jgi:hypothetical protein
MSAAKLLVLVGTGRYKRKVKTERYKKMGRPCRQNCQYAHVYIVKTKEMLE